MKMNQKVYIVAYIDQMTNQPKLVAFHDIKEARKCYTHFYGQHRVFPIYDERIYHRKIEQNPEDVRIVCYTHSNEHLTMHAFDDMESAEFYYWYYSDKKYVNRCYLYDIKVHPSFHSFLETK